MDELVEIKSNVTVNKTILVVDAMTGQDSVNVATEFNDKIGVDGLILSKMDGDEQKHKAHGKSEAREPVKDVDGEESVDVANQRPSEVNELFEFEVFLVKAIVAHGLH